MHAKRTRFAGEIVTEFLQPTEFSTKAIVLCGGMPGLSSKMGVMQFFAQRGFWVFNPRYRGTWESEGEFLAKSPEEDIRDVIEGITKGFTDVRTGERFAFAPSSVVLIGSSFGGPAALLLSTHPLVKKVIAVAPVVDWTAPSETEPMDWLGNYVKDAFGAAYRFSQERWDALSRGELYQPVNAAVAKEKVLLLHAQDDDVVDAGAVAKFAAERGIRLRMYRSGGHLGMSEVLRWRSRFAVKHFLRGV